MFQRWEDVTVSDELLGTYRAAQQVMRGIEQLPPFGLEPDMPFLAVSFSMSKAGIYQIIERASDRHGRVAQPRGYERRGSRSFVDPQEAMEQYSLSCWRKTVCVPLRVCAETFAQVHGKVRDIELVARHDERDALSYETRAVVCAQPRSNEDDKGVDGGANQGNVLRNVSGCRGVVHGGQENDASSSDVAFMKAVRPGEK